jgi:hypothetical protein
MHRLTSDWNSALRSFADFLSTHVTRKLGPIHPQPNPPDNFEDWTIDMRMNNKLRDMALYWEPDDSTALRWHK